MVKCNNVTNIRPPPCLSTKHVATSFFHEIVIFLYSVFFHDCFFNYPVQSIFRVSQQQQLCVSQPRICSVISYGTADAKVANTDCLSHPACVVSVNRSFIHFTFLYFASKTSSLIARKTINIGHRT